MQAAANKIGICAYTIQAMESSLNIYVTRCRTIFLYNKRGLGASFLLSSGTLTPQSAYLLFCSSRSRTFWLLLLGFEYWFAYQNLIYNPSSSEISCNACNAISKNFSFGIPAFSQYNMFSRLQLRAKSFSLNLLLMLLG